MNMQAKQCMGESLSVTENARSSAEVCHPLHVAMSYNISIIIIVVIALELVSGGGSSIKMGVS